jgi:hypothetical protein
MSIANSVLLAVSERGADGADCDMDKVIQKGEISKNMLLNNWADSQDGLTLAYDLPARSRKCDHFELGNGVKTKVTIRALNIPSGAQKCCTNL